MGPFHFRLVGWQRTAVYVTAFLLLWQLTEWFSDWAYPISGISPVYPVAGLDVLLLVYAGWRWWPLIPLSGVIHWLVLEHASAPLVARALRAARRWRCVCARGAFRRSNVFASACRCARSATSLGLAASSGSARRLHSVSPSSRCSSRSASIRPTISHKRFRGSSSAMSAGVMALVPAVITFGGWNALRANGDHQDAFAYRDRRVDRSDRVRRDARHLGLLGHARARPGSGVRRDVVAGDPVRHSRRGAGDDDRVCSDDRHAARRGDSRPNCSSRRKASCSHPR